MKNVNGEFYFNVLIGYSNLSLLYVSLGKVGEVLELVDKVIYIDIILFGNDNMLLVYWFNNRVCVLKVLDRNEEVLVYDFWFLVFFEKYFGIKYLSYFLL